MIRNMHSKPSQDMKLIGTMTVGPHEEAEFFVGLYESNIPQPILHLECAPANDGKLFTSLVRLDSPGDYILVYHFANTGKSTHTITVHAKWSD